MNLTIFVLFCGVIVPSCYAVLKLDNESELREAQAALFNVNSQSGWLLLNYVGPSTVHFTGGGEGTTSEFIPLLQDDQIQYLIVRLVVAEGVRDVFIVWIGPEIGIIEKRKKLAYSGDAEAYLQPFHSSVTVLSRENLNDQTLADRSHPLSGSHVID